MTEEVKDADQAAMDDYIQEAVGASEPQAEEPTAEAEPEVEPEVEIPESVNEPEDENNIQKRFNKLTADKYEEKRRADALQARLDELQKQNAPTEPTLEQYDYDDEAYANAKAEYIANQKVAEIQQATADQAALQEQAKVQAAFDSRVTEFIKDKPDFAEKAAQIPQLNPTVLEALKRNDHAADVIYHLGSNLDKAYDIASLDPTTAIMKIGELSAIISRPKHVKTPSAPEPIDVLSSGGVIEDDIGDPNIPIGEWMKKHNP